MKKQILLLLLMSFIAITVNAKTGIIKGTITSNGESIPGCLVLIKNLNGNGTVSDSNGNYSLEGVPEGSHTLSVSYLGYHTVEKKINIISNAQITEDIFLEEDLLNIDEVVVTGTRNGMATYQAPVIVSRISPTLFKSTQSLSLSEGLAFSPGLRVETNCQNCGFSQLRMNGLKGAYSQILINSRPIFSALVGVYGLDMIPANMIDRVEVVKGGGSALYGGSAIGGTVNIITKDPISDSFQFGLNQSFTDISRSDRTITINGNIVSDELDKGISIYASNRDRKPWDANEDGFTELTELKNNTFGMDAFWNTSEKGKVKLNMHSIDEFRRGGNKLNLEPHQTDITEQLDHRILSGGLSFEQYTNDYKHKFAIYTSIQDTKRKSYYGGGGRILSIGDIITDDDIKALNAYGRSKDISTASGLQYNYDISEKFTFSAGGEYIYNEVSDLMSGYNRSIEQTVGTLGSYVQLEIKPLESLTLLLGGRYDHVNIEGDYNFTKKFTTDKTLNVFVPRVSFMYDITKDIKLRMSYAQGYRGPQAFDEDLHIKTVGGTAVFVQLSPDLTEEKSDNITGSINYTKSIGDFQANIVLEGFYTKINDPFVTLELEKSKSDISTSNTLFNVKENGDALNVKGVNLELNLAYTSKFLAQLGFTFQKSEYKTPQLLWDSKNDTSKSNIYTDHILRSPDMYGFFSITYKPIDPLSFSWSGVYTGKMDIPHVVDLDTGYTTIKESPTFFENNFKLSYDYDFNERNCLELFAGIQNAFNKFQDDFDKGADRDAGYIYGPRKPRTVYMGLKYIFTR